MKKITLIFLSALLLFSLLSCNSQKQYSDSASTESIANAVVAALKEFEENVAYSYAEEGYFDDYFQVPDYVSDSIAFFATDGNNINEFGIFHVTNGNAKSMQSILDKYLKDCYAQNQSFYDSYIPEETPKLRDAEVKAFGNYVVFAIAHKDCRAEFFRAVEEQITLDP